MLGGLGPDERVGALVPAVDVRSDTAVQRRHWPYPTGAAPPSRAAYRLQIELEFLLAAGQPLRRIVLERLQLSLIVCGPDMLHPARTTPSYLMLLIADVAY